MGDVVLLCILAFYDTSLFKNLFRQNFLRVNCFKLPILASLSDKCFQQTVNLCIVYFTWEHFTNQSVLVICARTPSFSTFYRFWKRTISYRMDSHCDCLFLLACFHLVSNPLDALGIDFLSGKDAPNVKTKQKPSFHPTFSHATGLHLKSPISSTRVLVFTDANVSFPELKPFKTSMKL